MAKQKTKGSGVKSGLSSQEKFKAGEGCVSGQSGKNQVPTKPTEKVGKFKIG